MSKAKEKQFKAYASKKLILAAKKNMCCYKVLMCPVQYEFSVWKKNPGYFTDSILRVYSFNFILIDTDNMWPSIRKPLIKHFNLGQTAFQMPSNSVWEAFANSFQRVWNAFMVSIIHFWLFESMNFETELAGYFI